MPTEAGQAALKAYGIGAGHLRQRGSALVLQGPQGRHDHRRIRGKAAGPGGDVAELLRPQVRTEARLGDRELRQLHRRPGGDDGVAAMGDVGEWPAVHEHRGALQALDQVGLDGVAQQDGHGPVGLQVPGGHRGAIPAPCHDDPGEPRLQVRQVRGEAQDGHHLRGHGDVEAGLPRGPVGIVPQPHHDLAQGPVVHVQHPAPDNAPGVDVQGISPVDMVVQQGRQQVVGGGDGVEIPGEVEVDRLHRRRLGPAAAGGPALDAEHRAQGRLAKGDDGPATDPVQGIAQTYGGGGLPLPRRRRIDRGDQHQPSVRAIGQGRQVIEGHLGHVTAIGQQHLLRQPGPGGDLGNGTKGRCPSNLDVSGHGWPPPGIAAPQCRGRPAKANRLRPDPVSCRCR